MNLNLRQPVPREILMKHTHFTADYPDIRRVAGYLLIP